jgi:hypothetical protein
MFEKKFLEATAERAVKTFVQTLLALLGTDAAGVLSVDILAAIQVAGASALLSVLTSFGSSGVGKTGPSLAGESTEPKVLRVEVERIVEVAAKPAVTAKKAPSAKKPAASAKRTQK